MSQNLVNQFFLSRLLLILNSMIAYFTCNHMGQNFMHIILVWTTESNQIISPKVWCISYNNPSWRLKKFKNTCLLLSNYNLYINSFIYLFMARICRYFVAALSLACLYGIISILVSISVILGPSFAKDFLPFFVICDVVSFHFPVLNLMSLSQILCQIKNLLPRKKPFDGDRCF